MKKIMISFILGGITFGTIGALAANTISSNNVMYNNRTVKDSLDELYQKAMTNKVYPNGTAIYYNPVTNSKYAWLFDYMYDCTKCGCNIADSSNYGYWTSTPVAGSGSTVWDVNMDGGLNYYDANSPYRGVRPVITVSKSIIS